MFNRPDLQVSAEALRLLKSKFHCAAIQSPKGRMVRYKRLLVTADDMRAFGLAVNDSYSCVPTLVVPGTSIPFEETQEYLAWLIDQGYPVAYIEHPIGGLLDTAIHPKLERPLVLEHFLDCLRDQGPEKIKKVTGLFQSYAAFDVIRLIAKDPQKYKNIMPVFFLDNPAGFNGDINILVHIFRWQFMHLGSGLIKQVFSKFWGGAYPIPRGDAARGDYRKRELHDLWAWWKNTLKNPVRGGIRELWDICHYRAEEDMQKIQKAGYEVSVFKHSGDRILPLLETLKYAQKIFAQRLFILDGGHNDLFVQVKNRKAISEAMYI
jgi:hypothetical protein